MLIVKGSSFGLFLGFSLVDITTLGCYNFKIGLYASVLMKITNFTSYLF